MLKPTPLTPELSARCAIELPIAYGSQLNSEIKGRGRTLAMTARSVRFASDQDLCVGLKVWLSILWPIRLRNGDALKLSMFGCIERSALGEVDVAVSQHEFRRCSENKSTMWTDSPGQGVHA
jgi:hypothetical protein